MVCSIVVVGSLARRELLHSVRDLIATEMNVRYGFELGHNTADQTKKKNGCMKGGKYS